MRFRRITTRRAMTGILILALVQGAIREVRRLVHRRAYYLDRAEVHAYWQFLLRHPDASVHWEYRWQEQFQGHVPPEPFPKSPPFVPAMYQYHTRMRARWLHAAARPWIDVEPDARP